MSRLQRQLERMLNNSRRSQYQIVRQTSEIVWIEDLGVGKTVTNDAEAVCAELFNEVGNKRIIYKDTDGNWDELLHDKGYFTGYKAARDLSPSSVTTRSAS